MVIVKAGNVFFIEEFRDVAVFHWIGYNIYLLINVLAYISMTNVHQEYL
jgi:hypothetical protein